MRNVPTMRRPPDHAELEFAMLAAVLGAPAAWFAYRVFSALLAAL